MLVQIVANSALLAFIPTAFVLSVVPPDEATLAMSFVFLELTLVLLAVGPEQVAKSVHLVVQPHTGVLLLVAPDVDSFPLDLVHLEFSLVH